MDNFTIEDFMVRLLQDHRTVDVANSEFRRIIADDADIAAQYREWCEEQGRSPRNGFQEFADEYLADRESVWESLNDYDDEY